MPFKVQRIKDPAQSADKYKRKTEQAGPDLLAGFQSPRKDPKKAAQDAAPKWKTRIEDAIKNDRFKINVGKYDENEALATMEAVGIDAYVKGTAARLPKVKRTMTKLAAAQLVIAQHIDGMPNVTDADREARSLYQQREMRKLKGTFK